MRVEWCDLDLWRRGEIGQVEGVDVTCIDLAEWIAAETEARGAATIHDDDLRLKVGPFSVLEQIEGLQILGLVTVS